ncbi:hypothetical protein QAD02_023556 [Eretmocerus hayati]|uniref:Uncharacterized protein n=1 Tax=Eretmocerus hayati TaxID=131215 RepID=A0ACC2PZJ3_9HYME|nr:hypothetical protein QAD02_023556 [Eretmocerus hayati]
MALTRIQKLAVTGVGMFIYSILFRAVILPVVMDFSVKQKVALKEGTMGRGIWSKVPFPLGLDFYFFNVTNPSDVEKGEKPILQEIGPFAYDEWQMKTNLTDYKADDTVSYTRRSTFYFNETRSAGHTEDDEVVIPNLFILGLIGSVLKERPTAIPLVAKALDAILKKPTTVFMKEKVRNILFDGFEIDCNVQGVAGTAVCGEIKAAADDFGLKVIGENVYLFSLWGSRNATDSKTVTKVRRGAKNIKNVGVVVEYDNKNNMSKWSDDYCDTFNGTDSTIFHPFFDNDGKEDVVIFNPDVCRSFSLEFEDKIKFRGLTLNRYTTSFGVDIEKYPQHKCFCVDPDDCPKGIYDVYKCVKAPIIISNPHFYNADPRYLDMVEGLHPDKEKHAMVFDFDPFSGSPFRVFARVQFNMYIQPLAKFKLMKNFPNALLPLFWIEQSMYLPKFLIKEVKLGHVGYSLAILSQYSLMFGGILLSGLAGFLQVRENSKNKTVKKVKTANVANASRGQQNGFNSGNKTPTSVTNVKPAPTKPAPLPTFVD